MQKWQKKSTSLVRFLPPPNGQEETPHTPTPLRLRIMGNTKIQIKTFHHAPLPPFPLSPLSTLSLSLSLWCFLKAKMALTAHRNRLRSFIHFMHGEVRITHFQVPISCSSHIFPHNFASAIRDLSFKPRVFFFLIFFKELWYLNWEWLVMFSCFYVFACFFWRQFFFAGDCEWSIPWAAMHEGGYWTGLCCESNH